MFNKLKEDNIHPIFISFNGQYKVSTSLTKKESILHAIAIQLTNPDDIKGCNIICNEEKLNEYLGNDSVVLLIDELNVLSNPIECEASTMLKKLFLDKTNQYLVFSTHLLIDIDSSNLSQFITTESFRFCIYLDFKPTTNIQLLRDLVRNISVLEAMYYGMIPSLIYSVKSKKLIFITIIRDLKIN